MNIYIPIYVSYIYIHMFVYVYMYMYTIAWWHCRARRTPARTVGAAATTFVWGFRVSWLGFRGYGAEMTCSPCGRPQNKLFQTNAPRGISSYQGLDATDALNPEAGFQSRGFRARRIPARTAGAAAPTFVCGLRVNYFTDMCSGSEAGSYLRLIYSEYHSTLGLRVIKEKKDW